MELDSNLQEKIEELQSLEATLQSFLAQRQSIEMELNESNNDSFNQKIKKRVRGYWSRELLAVYYKHDAEYAYGILSVRPSL